MKGVRWFFLCLLALGLVYATAEASGGVTATPENIPSGGTTQLHAPEELWCGPIITWAWSDHGAGGAWWPGPSAQNPKWTAPGNLTSEPVQHWLTVSLTAGTCGTGGGVYVWEEPAAHYLSVLAFADATFVTGTGTVHLSAEARDTLGHTDFSWEWSDKGADGTFWPDAYARTPTYTAPPASAEADLAVELRAIARCSFDPEIMGEGAVPLTILRSTPTFLDVPPDHWAYVYIEACQRGEIIQGYPTGNFKPDAVLTRAQMAVFVARTLGLVK